ncbi:response regulator [Thioalkalicoccus limnaeus]|uniref:Response regulator n=1 Tax=Thioalkalicoccus limnaeus TaxID=120681 RepID=A0ABV4BF83_9GAMM
MRILVVDDDPLAGEMAVAILEASEHRCRRAENVLEALEMLAAAEGFDLVVSDMNMPLLNGLELLGEMRDRGIGVPFVLLTGDDPATLSAKTTDLGGCLMKDGSLETSLPRLVAELDATSGSTVQR